MLRTTRTFCLLLSFIALFGMLLFAQAPATRPAGVPEGYLATPFGYFHPSCVLRLAEGETLLAEGRILQHADGTRENRPECKYPHYAATGAIVGPGATKVDTPTISGWVESASVTTSTSYGEIVATWTVPSAPTANVSQVVYFFPGMEDSSDVQSIIQPVLGWNMADSGISTWSIASWNCCLSGTTDYSTPVAVNVGDTITGTVKSTCKAGTESCATWNITTEDVTLNKSTTLSNSPSDGQTFNWAFGAVLEAYYIATCSDLPASAVTTFSNIGLYDYNFNIIASPAWSATYWASGDTPQCNYDVIVNSPSEITLDYGTAGPPPWTFSSGLPSNPPCNFPSNYVSFSLNQQTNGNSLQWSESLSESFEGQELIPDLNWNWTLSDNDGELLSGGGLGTENLTAPRAPVGTPTVAISGYLIAESGCYATFRTNLTGTN